MANNYLLFSEIVKGLAPVEEGWMIRMLRTVDEIDEEMADPIHSLDNFYPDDPSTWPDIKWIAEQLGRHPLLQQGGLPLFMQYTQLQLDLRDGYLMQKPLVGT